MRFVNPVDPHQLPPQTDDFTFCNVSNQPAGPIHYQVAGPAGNDHADIPNVPPQATAMVHGTKPIEGTQVVCDANVGGQPFHFEFDETPEGFYIAKVICGAQDGRKGGFVPFGEVILRDHNGGILVVAFEPQ